MRCASYHGRFRSFCGTSTRQKTRSLNQGAHGPARRSHRGRQPLQSRGRARRGSRNPWPQRSPGTRSAGASCLSRFAADADRAPASGSQAGLQRSLQLLKLELPADQRCLVRRTAHLTRRSVSHRAPAAHRPARRSLARQPFQVAKLEQRADQTMSVRRDTTAPGLRQRLQTRRERRGASDRAALWRRTGASDVANHGAHPTQYRCGPADPRRVQASGLQSHRGLQVRRAPRARHHPRGWRGSRSVPPPNRLPAARPCRPSPRPAPCSSPGTDR